MILKNYTKNYTTIPNELIIDDEISNGAFRLYCYLASKPETWEINNTDISRQLKIGSNNSLNKYWKELIKVEWIEKSREQDKTGKFTSRTILTLFENRNRTNCENGEIPLSQKNHYRKNCINGKSAKHSNTNPISKLELRSKTDKESKKKENSHTKLRNEKSSELMQKLNVDDNFIDEVIDYRKAIKAPILTTQALNLFLNSILKVVETYKVSPDNVFEYIAGKQWQGINHTWDEVKKEFGNKQVVAGGGDMSGFSKVGQETARNAQAAMEKIKLMQQQGGF